MNAHTGLSDAQSRRLDAALVLLLASKLTDVQLLRHCLREARAALLLQDAHA